MLLVLVLASAALADGDAQRGQAVYTANCMACHGQKADGNGPAAAALKPRPTDFTQAAWWKGQTPAGLKAVIKSGKPGTSMMGFGRLSDRQLDDVVAFLQSKAP